MSIFSDEGPGDVCDWNNVIQDFTLFDLIVIEDFDISFDFI